MSHCIRVRTKNLAWLVAERAPKPLNPKATDPAAPLEVDELRTSGQEALLVNAEPSHPFCCMTDIVLVNVSATAIPEQPSLVQVLKQEALLDEMLPMQSTCHGNLA